MMHIPVRRQQARRVVAVLLCLGLLSGLGLPVTANQAFTDPNGTFTLTIPDGWRAQQPSNPSYMDQWGTADGNAVAFLTWQALAPGTSSQDFYYSERPGIARFPGYDPVGTSTVSANGGIELLIEYRIVANSGQRLRVQRLYIASGTDGWILTFMTYDTMALQYLPAFATMAQSFTLTPSGNAAPTTTAQGPPLVHYACEGSYSQFYAGGFTLSARGAYSVDDDAGGSWTFDAGTSRITFTSGPYADAFYGDYELETSATSSTPTIYIRALDGTGGALSCQPGY